MARPHDPTGEAPKGSLTYSSYLALGEILSAQRTKSDEHDEMLFIVVHQVYELWFKQLLHELREAQRRLETGDTSHAVRTLRRCLSILKVAVHNIDVLETMTPTQFLTFRDRLDASSGFQSAQFRVLEAVLGRRDRSVLRHYVEGSEDRRRIEEALSGPNLYDSYLRFLARAGYDVEAERDWSEPLAPDERNQRAVAQVYKDDAGAAVVTELLVDLDEGFQEWRYRHVMMVKRTLGEKRGTGGSSGVDYLRSTVFRAAFPDLWAVRSGL
jgi:tryptophan 2,3-dioxygenase